jgi:hypothetical protein
LLREVSAMAKKKRVKRRHRVSCNMQVLELTRAGSSISFEVFASGEKIGKIIIGRGSLTWSGRNRHHGKTLSWSRFAKLMDDYSYGPG